MGDMMPTVYSPDESCEGLPCMEPDPYGGWVSLDDYAALRAERDVLRADLLALVPLVQAALHSWDYVWAKQVMPDTEVPKLTLNREQVTVARAILDRVATEGA